MNFNTLLRWSHFTHVNKSSNIYKKLKIDYAFLYLRHEKEKKKGPTCWFQIEWAEISVNIENSDPVL